jgi:L-seryl-tRNA(Ser) seleniumtransferase
MSEAAQAASLRQLPAVGSLLEHPRLLESAWDHEALVQAVREELITERQKRLAGEAARSRDALAEASLARLQRWISPSLKRVVNATGVVIHTGLGRSPLAVSALEAIVESSSGYTNLEVDLDTGKRGSRQTHIEDLICCLSGAEASLVVNNGAAAVLLLTTALAFGREVVVSRGQLIEIGGSFRLPEVLQSAGARLVEVGTTNRTYSRDYEVAIGPDTAMLLRTHTSNYRVVGFTSEVSAQELARIGREAGIITAWDLGSGLFLSLAPCGIENEPTVAQCVEAGLDLLTFSGDKLLGGPQCGIVVGRKALVEKLKRHPLMRALRPDKLALAALEGTLSLYVSNESAWRNVPVLAMLAAAPAALKQAAERLALRLEENAGLEIAVKEGVSPVGGGSLPGAELPSWLVVMRAAGLSNDAFAKRLRLGKPSVMARIAFDQVVLDLRTCLEGDEERIVQAVSRALL